ncbi:MAG: RagB/SusD family nutrient uptake outer membrane protein [Bacteroidales bacterium]|nr:RagB/SusD family nutrient uptake outer membrane protein [Bacteroidales bacterium]
MAKVLSTPEDLKGVASGLYQEWFSLGHSSSNGPAMPLITMADHQTCSWGNFGMRALSSEPRAAFNNLPTYDYVTNFQVFVETRFSIISQANDVLSSVLLNGAQIGAEGSENNMVLAWAYFNRGLAYAQIGMLYDASPIATHEDLTNTDLQSYQTVTAQAISDFDEAITYCSSSFTLPAPWFAGVALTNAQLKMMINSYAARYMVLSARTKAENDATDWTKVKTYAENGIDFDLSVMCESNLWYSSYIAQSASPTWLHTDLRVINLMDPAYPDRYSDDGTEPDPKFATSNDARLTTYFDEIESCGFRPERGYYHFSTYKFNRYNYLYDNWINGIAYDYKVTENDMYLAEALLHTAGSKTTVAQLINKTRVSIGTLAALDGTETDAALMDAIFYERALELVYTGVGIEFCDMRRRDMLQYGTLLHFPVPGAHLEIYGLDYYTYGGVENADGINTSNTGWFK